MEQSGGFESNTNGLVKKTFISHVFSTTDEGKAEVINVMQYSGLALIPVVILNKVIQRFIPEADPDKSSLEILFEVILQILVIFCALIFIHRTITFVPTYSGFKYDSFALTSTVLTFLVVVLSIQTKLGIKVTILFERVTDLWNGTDSRADEKKEKVRVKQPLSRFNASQADNLDSSLVQSGMFPPAPVATTPQQKQAAQPQIFEPVAANSMIGSSFGSFF